LIFYLLESFGKKEEDICKEFKLKPTSLTELCMDLLEGEIIRRWKSNDDGHIIYTLDNKYFDLDELCRKCKFKSIKSVATNGKKVKLYYCELEGIECVYNFIRKYYCFLKVIKRNFKRVMAQGKLDRRVLKEPDYRHVDDWIESNFVRFFFDKFMEINGAACDESKVIIRRNIRECREIFVKKCKRKWKRHLKHYMVSMLRKYDNENRTLRSIMLINILNIDDFLKSLGSGFVDINMCPLKEIYCSYCVGGKCSLEKNKIDCTEIVVQRMKEKYN
jgi:hypothetical protein